MIHIKKNRKVFLKIVLSQLLSASSVHKSEGVGDMGKGLWLGALTLSIGLTSSQAKPKVNF